MKLKGREANGYLIHNSNEGHQMTKSDWILIVLVIIDLVCWMITKDNVLLYSSWFLIISYQLSEIHRAIKHYNKADLRIVYRNSYVSTDMERIIRDILENK